ncbi:MAG: hypothetical protein BJ554DRAFT_4425, partial [Olpidium bornovanus]
KKEKRKKKKVKKKKVASDVAKSSRPEHTKQALRTLARLVAGAARFAEVFDERSNDKRWLKTKILKQKRDGLRLWTEDARGLPSVLQV